MVPHGADATPAWPVRVVSIVLLALGLGAAGASAQAQNVPDFSAIRGVNYGAGWRDDPAIVERDLGYGKQLNLNSVRVWLSYRAYQQDSEQFLDQVENFVRVAYRSGYTTQPILFNGNGLDPAILREEFRPEGDAYVRDVVARLQDEDGLIMWDVMNEPEMNDYYLRAPEAEQPAREAELRDFVRYYVRLVEELDPATPLTVGYGTSQFVEHSADLVDVISYHDYMPTRARAEANLQHALDVAREYGDKPVMNNETGCIARANPYDMILQILDEHDVGWYIFELMIDGYWGEIHGIFYPDGTIRDPSVVAAVMGIFRNRDIETMIRPDPNREGQAVRAIRALEDALSEDTRVFGNTEEPSDALLEAAEYAANLLESAEMVPMIEPPTAQIQYWRSLPEDERPREEIRAFAYELGNQLKKWNKIY